MEFGQDAAFSSANLAKIKQGGGGGIKVLQRLSARLQSSFYSL